MTVHLVRDDLRPPDPPARRHLLSIADLTRDDVERLLGTARTRDYFVSILAEVRTKYSFQLIGYVVMPEHIHLLITEPGKGNPSKVLQVLKQRVSRILLAKRRNSNHPAEQHFWQRRFYDFNVWTGGKLTEKLEYMHMNPVKRGLVSHPKDWPWSSFSFYADGQRGLVRIDLVN